MKRQKTKKSLLLPALCTCGLLIAVVAIVSLRTPRAIELPYLTAEHIAVLDTKTGKTVYEKGADLPVPPASLTKLMTLFLVFDEIKAGNLSYADTLLVTENEAESTGSQYGLRAGEEVTVEQLIAGTALCSGCDCVQGLLRLMATSEEDWAVCMNEKAKELGMDGSHFLNATGLDNQGHYMTANDIARLSQQLIKKHPEYLDFSSQAVMSIAGKEFRNLNQLVGQDSRVLGLKTGTTPLGGNSLVTYAVENDRGYLIVLLNSNNESSRYQESSVIIDTLLGPLNTDDAHEK